MIFVLPLTVKTKTKNIRPGLHLPCLCRGSWVFPHYLILTVPLMEGSQSLTVCCQNHKTSSFQHSVHKHACKSQRCAQTKREANYYIKFTVELFVFSSTSDWIHNSPVTPVIFPPLFPLFLISVLLWGKLKIPWIYSSFCWSWNTFNWVSLCVTLATLANFISGFLH